MRRRAQPVRTCIGCRARAPKRELIRIVRSRDGGLALDLTQTAPGRGAYVHASRTCVAAARSHRRLRGALRASTGLDEAARLLEEIEGIVRQT